MWRRKYGRAPAKEQKIMSREERLRRPPRFEMPWRIRREVIREELLKEDPWWWTGHRRGLRRPLIGEDPREARAVSKAQVNGTLPERIVYLRLTQMHIYFDFQSSQEGGRMELGGMIADFILPDYMYVIQVQGPTHNEFFQTYKDKEQRNILAEMGYTVFYIEERVVYDEYALEDWLRRLFGLGGIPAGGSGQTTAKMDTIQEPGDTLDLDMIWDDLVAVGDIFEQWQR